ncbi:Alpha/Beta hydrolase protein [Podospora fimiseda]|uniref:Alpha/Beta hydrolase protein n=1 Tax=Podospora fimiseda TaxID=252190 RepID=A0AAN7BE12_9PEZI|nr:Alpha/Beta hydrolase protein [Podospora fimiseda]
MSNTASILGTSGAINRGGKVRTVPALPLTQRLKYYTTALTIQRFILPPLVAFSEFKNYYFDPNFPNLVKTCPSRPDLPIRVFYPPNYKPSSDSPKLPCLLTIHGGGFVLGHAHDNDGWNRAFVTKNPQFMTVALSYRKAPASPFPAPITEDLAPLIPLVLDDIDLRIDKSKVAIAGWSAGGNLSLSVSQHPAIRPLIKAAIPLYPIVDWVPPQDVKSQTRRYKPSLGGFRAKDKDFLLALSGLFNWAYVSAGQDCMDPFLSPIYAQREHLPKNVFMVGCEMDMLGQEAWRMICGLAGRRVPLIEEVIGREAIVGHGELITEGDERYSWEEFDESDGTRYKWLLVPDQVHGFDQDSIGNFAVGDGEMLRDARAKRDKVIGKLGEWLVSVFEGEFQAGQEGCGDNE